jgi:hypothetical protein
MAQSRATAPCSASRSLASPSPLSIGLAAGRGYKDLYIENKTVEVVGAVLAV